MANGKINVDFTTGNFDLGISGSLNPDKVEAAQAAGVRYIVQRDGASKAYKTLFGDDAGDKKRKELEYSEENAEAVRQAFEDAMSGYGSFAVTVSEHEASETVGSRKMATELWAQAKENPALVAALGVDAGASDEIGIEAAHKFLGGLRAKPAKG